MKKLLLFGFILSTRCLWAQQISFSAGYTLTNLKASSEKITTESEFSAYYKNPNSTNQYTQIREKTKYSFNRISKYDLKNGFAADINLRWPLGKKLYFNSGLGVQYIDFQATATSSEYSSEILSRDTINKNVTFDTDNSTNYKFRNQRSDFSVVPGDNYKLLYLSIPFSVSYDLGKSNLGITLGGKLNALLQGKQTKEAIINSYEYIAVEKTNWVTYSKVTNVLKVNNNLNNWGLSTFVQLDYRYKTIGFNLQVAQNLTDIFRYNSNESNFNDDYFFGTSTYSVRPTFISFKAIYFLSQNKRAVKD